MCPVFQFLKSCHPVLVYMINSKLDPESLRLSEQMQSRDLIPTFKQLTAFLDQRTRVLSNVQLTMSIGHVLTARRNIWPSNDCSNAGNNGLQLMHRGRCQLVKCVK